MERKSFFKMTWRRLLICAVLLSAIYGAGRLYYRVTHGFTIDNITSTLPFDPRWETHPLAENEKIALNQLLSQPFHYLGKGCQSYVFGSEDGQFVLKFFKYQRFRPQEWLKYFSYVPGVESYRQGKILKKKRKLENVYQSWMIAYTSLQPETGVVYVHLNKGKGLPEQLTIVDKIGLKHTLDPNQYEFMIQRRAVLLCPTIDRMMAHQQEDNVKRMIDDLLAMILFEYARGFADNDHALMQNTGVLAGKPIHIDAGQFIRNDLVKDPAVHHQELFSKTFKFRKWLGANHPTLETHLTGQLRDLIGEKMEVMKPELNKASMGRIPNA